MKTFKNLSINDKLFYINKNGNYLDNKDKYGNIYHKDLMIESVIESLKIDKGYLFVNFNDRYELIKIPIECLEDVVYEKEDYLYFSDKNKYDDCVKKIVLEKIKETEDYIVKITNEKNDFIINLKKAYWDYLNNTGLKLDNPENKIK